MIISRDNINNDAVPTGGYIQSSIARVSLVYSLRLKVNLRIIRVSDPFHGDLDHEVGIDGTVQFL